jgi:TolB-like protein
VNANTMGSHAVTLALLPLENLSGSPADERLARGFAQDLLTELARFPALGVIAADSVAAAGRENPGDAEVGRRLGALFLLKGSVRRSGRALRLSVQLIEAASGRLFWAGRYDEERLPTLQDEIAARVANALALQVDQSLLDAARRRPPATLEAYECWLRGVDSLRQGTCESDAEGRRFFEQALTSDPHYARAHAGISMSHFNEWSCQRWEAWEEKERLAYEAAVRAEALDPHDAEVQIILARIEQYRRLFDRVGPRLERIQNLAPNNANILVQLAACRAYQGDGKTAWQLARRALELNPLCPGWFYCHAALPSFVCRRYEESLEMAAKAPAGMVVDVPAYQAAALAYLGRAKEAAAFLEEFRRDFQRRIAFGREMDEGELLHWTLHVNPYRKESDAEHLLEGLRRAGLEPPKARRTPSGPAAWPVANVFRREGDTWTLVFDHNAVRMPDLRGLHDVAKLLARPGGETSCAELAGLLVVSAGLEKADSRSLHEYRERLRELEEALEEASQSGLVERAEALEAERDKILRELKAATGLGGEGRRAGGTGEKARTAVTWRIRHAIRKITAVHPALGRHLEVSIRTGAFCSYAPERATTWQL